MERGRPVTATLKNRRVKAVNINVLKSKARIERRWSKILPGVFFMFFMEVDSGLRLFGSPYEPVAYRVWIKEVSWWLLDANNIVLCWAEEGFYNSPLQRQPKW